MYLLKAHSVPGTVQGAWIKSTATLPAVEATLSLISIKVQRLVPYIQYKIDWYQCLLADLHSQASC